MDFVIDFQRSRLFLSRLGSGKDIWTNDQRPNPPPHRAGASPAVGLEETGWQARHDEAGERGLSLLGS